MAPANVNRPAWVVKDLASVLGLDEETIKEMIVPDLESYTHEARLRVHLQDFLGSSPQAKSFTAKYLSLRFPSLTNTASVPAPAPASIGDDLLKPTSNYNTKSKAGKSQSGSRGGSASGSARLTPTATYNHGHGQGDNIPDALNAAFGPGGKVYQKNRDVDISWGRSTSSGPASRGGGGGSAPGSGSHTPLRQTSSQQPKLRQAGAVSVQVQEPKPVRIDNLHPSSAIASASAIPQYGGSTSSSNSGSRTNSGKGKQRGSGEDKIWDQPKSREVKKLESIKEKLRMVKEGEGQGKVNLDEGVKCFCQARIHTLSSYTPLCQSCGLVICSLHPAHLPCPSCAHALSTPAQLARLILRLEVEIENQLAKEERQRQEAERERLARLAAEAGGGAFPTLNGRVPTPVYRSNTPGAGAGGGRRVITIGGSGGGAGKGKGKGKSTITTTTYRPSPSPSNATGSGTPASKSRAKTPPPSDVMPRLRYNPINPEKVEKEVRKLLSWREETDRPFGDIRAEKPKESGDLTSSSTGCWKYKDMEVVHVRPEGEGDGRRRRAKARRGEGGREVPGAGA
ncbi:hypothetical protein I317_07733 [Kwoniella heveanensis CBS 569]|nr:hypothetical protein I317_07733 [Kwoniella heveanensis CBS 569]